jgi:ABC-2 type transport system permease protein
VKVFAKLAWLELKLLLREPLTALFALILPLTVLFVMGGVFGNERSDPEVYRGVGSMDYYVPAYLALVTAAVGVISLPTHLAADRERGVLKRYRASGIATWALAGSQVVVTLVIALVSAVVLVAAAMPAYEVAAPTSLGMVIVGFLLVVLDFAAIGLLLGAVLPSSRAAQALGVLLWFVFLMIGGAGPPPEVLSGAVGSAGEWTPLRQAILVMQDGWLGLDPGAAWVWVAVTTVVAAAAAIRFFRWE